MATIDPNWELSVHDVKRMLDEKADFLLLDVREPGEHAIVHIEGAELIPLGQLPSALPRLQKHADKAIVTHCHKGGRSLDAAVFLRQNGFENVRSMAGGIDAWAVHVDRSKPRY